MNLRRYCTLIACLFVTSQKVHASALSLEVVAPNLYPMTPPDLNSYHISFVFRVDETLPSPTLVSMDENVPFRFALDRSYGREFLIYSRFIASGAAEKELISDWKWKGSRNDGFNFNIGYTF